MTKETEKQDVKKSGIVKITSGGSADRFWNPRFWDGMTVCALWKLFCAGKWRIAPFRLPMAFIVSCLSVSNSILAGYQKLRYGKKLRETKLVGEPMTIWPPGSTGPRRTNSRSARSV